MTGPHLPKRPWLASDQYGMHFILSANNEILWRADWIPMKILRAMVKAANEADIENQFAPANDSGMCTICSTRTLRSERHDAWYCPKCNLWCEKVCDDANRTIDPCPYCFNRPARPQP